MKQKHEELQYHLMLLPGTLLLVLFSIVPMFGIVLAFKEFNPALGIFGSPWTGIENFEYLALLPDMGAAVLNSLLISICKIVGNIICALTFALLLNEVRNRYFKRTIQTVTYLPHFVSWVLLASIFYDIFSGSGFVNKVIVAVGGQPELFMGSNFWFRPIVILTDIWKEYGFSAIIYLAALAGIDPALYESAEIDGANRVQKIFHISLPGVSTTVVLLATLALGGIMDANFDQIFNMYNPIVYQTGDIIDTLVYRLALENLQFSIGTAVGLFKSIISFILILIAYRLANRFANYRIF